MQSCWEMAPVLKDFLTKKVRVEAAARVVEDEDGGKSKSRGQKAVSKCS